MIDRIALQEIAKIVQGGRHGLSGNQFVTTGFPAYGAGGLNGYLPNFEFDRDAVILSSIGARCGKCFFARGKWSSLANTQVILPEEKIADAKFLWFQLNDERRWPRSGTGQPFIRPADVKEHIVILPPLSEQKRVAALLEKTDRLRGARRYARQLSDTFLESVFLEMFGDPVANPKHWESHNLRRLCLKFSDGPFGSNLKSSHYKHEGIRVVRLQNIGVGDFIDEDKAFIAPSHFADLAKHECVPGDVLIGTLGDPNLRACLLPPSIPLALNKADCVQARVDEKRCDREYVRWLLNIPSAIHLAPGMAHGQTRTRISMGQLAVLPVPVPPLPLQQKFALVVRRFERLRAQQREAERQAQHLFQTLLHRAFNGGI